MKLSNYFWYNFKEITKADTVISHEYCVRGGFIKMLTSGIYLWNPPGLKVLKKIEQIVREEMDKSNACECLFSCIQPADLWRESGRYDDYGLEMLRIKDRHENEMLFGPTNEEVATFLFKSYVKSYKDLPINLYQIQWKFRDEIRPRFGLMRAREFLMKDSYSFDTTHDAAMQSYNTMYAAYLRIFKRLGVRAIAVKADTGPIGGDASHEFQIFANNGEGKTFYDARLLKILANEHPDIEQIKNLYAATDEMHEKNPKSLYEGLDLQCSTTIEIGHLFNFDTKYSAPLSALIQGSDNKQTPVYMGSYGIGISRLFAAIIEASHDERGIIWPESVAPFKYAIIDNCNLADDIFYTKLQNAKYDFIYDDTSANMSSKLQKWDLFGVPYQVIIGKEYKESGRLELKSRKTGEIKLLTVEEFLQNA